MSGVRALGRGRSHECLLSVVTIVCFVPGGQLASDVVAAARLAVDSTCAQAGLPLYFGFRSSRFRCQRRQSSYLLLSWPPAQIAPRLNPSAVGRGASVLQLGAG